MNLYRLTEIHAVPTAEGVRVRVEDAVTYAVRNKDKDIAVRERREKRPVRQWLERIPFARGIARFWFCIYDLIDGLQESEELMPQNIVRGSRKEQRFYASLGLKASAMIAIGTTLAVLFYIIGFLFVIPKILESLLALTAMPFALSNGLICVSRMAGLVFAMWRVSHLRILNRLSMYRGAIAKVLNAYRDGQNHSFEDCLMHSRICPKYDCAFILLTVLLAIPLISAVNASLLWRGLLLRVALLLLISAIFGEVFYALEDRETLFKPFVWLEQLFIIEPHSQMIEVAQCALESVLDNLPAPKEAA